MDWFTRIGHIISNSGGNRGSAVLVLVPFLRNLWNKMEKKIKGPPLVSENSLICPSLIPRPYILILLE